MFNPAGGCLFDDVGSAHPRANKTFLLPVQALVSEVSIYPYSSLFVWSFQFAVTRACNLLVTLSCACTSQTNRDMGHEICMRARWRHGTIGGRDRPVVEAPV
jgi:hypothetical protein